MTFEIIDTTDGRHEGELIEIEGKIVPGDEVTHKDVSFKVDDVVWVDEMNVKLISSGYIATFRVVGA